MRFPSIRDLGKLFADAPAPLPAPEMGEVAYADVVNRLFGDPKKAFPVYNPNEVAAKKGIRYFTKMARDDQVKAALALKRYAVIAGGWTVNSPDGKDREWEPTKFVDETLKELGCTLEGAVDGILSKFTYGFSFTEKVWAERDNMLVLADLKSRHPFGINFQQDAYGNTLRITQGWGTTNDGPFLPTEKFLLCVHDQQFSNPYGQSDLESAYRPWWIKENSYKWMAMLLEKMGIPPIFINYDSNTIKGQALTDLKAIVSNLQAATNALLPRGATKDTIDFWAPELAGQVATVFAPAIRLLNEDIARAILMPALLGLTPDTNIGSQARSTVHFDIFMLIVERERKYLETMLNRRVVRDLVDYNFAGLGNDRPRLQIMPITDDKKVALYTLWGELTAQKIVTPQADDEKHIREVLRFPELTEDAAKRREAQEAAGAAAGGDPGAPTPKAPGGAPTGDGSADLAPDTYLARFMLAPEEQARRDMERAETSMLADMRAALAESRDAMVDAMRRAEGLTVRFAEGLRLRKIGDIQAAIEEGLRTVYQAGTRGITYQLRGAAAVFDSTGVAGAVVPRSAVSYLKQKSVQISGVIRDDITAKAKQLILDAVTNGEALEVTIQKALELFMPYLGAEEGIDAEVIKPYRLETIIRTNVTDAYNQGRLASIMDPELLPLLAAVKFSAILDTRTTEQCRLMHGKYFRTNDPELRRAAPPLHFNCRSILVPVTRSSAKRNPIAESDFVTPSLLGKVQELSNVGSSTGHNFYSLLKPICGGSDLEHLKRYAAELGLDMDLPEEVA